MNQMQLKAGCAGIALPSPVGLELCGYGYYLNRRCTGEMDPLFVRTVVLKNEEKQALIVSLDLIGLDEKTSAQIRDAICGRFGFKQSEVLLVCTHTHTGPATNQLEGCGEISVDYQRQLSGCVIQAVQLAINNLALVESTQECRNTVDDPIGYNRVSSDGPHDAVVRGVILKRKGAQPIAILSYPCHPVTLGRSSLSSADYPGAVCRQLHESGVMAVFLNGCCGDIDPVSNREKWGSGTQETLNKYASVIIEKFKGGLTESASHDLKTMECSVHVSLLPLTENDILDLQKRGSMPKVAQFWKDKMLAGISQEKELTVQVRAVKIGSVVFCGIPFEGFTCIGEEARSASGEKNLVILGCADWTRTYLPDIRLGEECSYAALDAAMLYGHALIAPGSAVMVGRQLGEKLKMMYDE